jgi:hypothetical protein
LKSLEATTVPDETPQLLANLVDLLQQRVAQEDRAFAFQQEQARQSDERSAEFEADRDGRMQELRKNREKTDQRIEQSRAEGIERYNAEAEFRRNLLAALERIAAEMSVHNERLSQVLEKLPK